MHLHTALFTGNGNEVPLSTSPGANGTKTHGTLQNYYHYYPATGKALPHLPNQTIPHIHIVVRVS